MVQPTVQRANANQILTSVLKAIPAITIIVEQIQRLDHATTKEERTAAVMEIVVAGLLAAEVITNRDLVDDAAFKSACVEVVEAVEAVWALVPRQDPIAPAA